MNRSADKTLNILALGLRASHWALTNGGHSNFYWDLDAVLTSQEDIDYVANQYLTMIESVKNEIGHIDRLAFIEKGSGPIGALTLKDLLIVRSGIPGLVVRVQRRILSSAIKGRNALHAGEKVVLISDVATSGASIIKAAKVIWGFRAKVLSAIVFFDREQGAIENLKRVDIELKSFAQRSIYQDKFPEMEQIPINLSSNSYTKVR